ncbi:ArsR/SmtB family transcription factor [Kitasatospora sp. KL5]|uniref:ArsR/SmtB family transcription factor n=1 Tax=Kitasatospora sp. KL5 TaxID=3425125 RepID=UPI003D6E6CAB
MGHGVDARNAASTRERLDAVGATDVAATLQALATPSRLRILARLNEGPCAVGDLAEAVGMEASACSHQLRLLRNLGLVATERRGRSIVYSLYDHHVAELLDQALFHVEHLRLGLRDEAEPAVGTRPAAVR